MNSIPHLLTFPRSGSHYLDELIYNKLGISIEKSHSVTSIFDKNGNKQRTLITIVRDPIESISSYIALSEKDFGPSGYTRIDQTLTEHILMHSFLLENADYIIDFKDLVQNPNATVDKLLNKLEIKEKDYIFFNREYNTKHPEYIESSKSLDGYRRHDLNEFNIELCYLYYNKLLNKKIVI